MQNLRLYFQARDDIDWVRSKISAPYGVELLVAPVDDAWSELERLSMKNELERYLGCAVQLTDERAWNRSPNDWIEDWSLVKPGDAVRRGDIERTYRERTLCLGPAAREMSADLERHLGRPDRKWSSDRAFAGIIKHAEDYGVFHEELPLDHASIAEMAREAAAEALRLCCEIQWLLARQLPVTIRSALAFLVTTELLPSECAVRLADFVRDATHQDVGSPTDGARIRRLLEVRTADLSALSDAAMAAATLSAVRRVEAGRAAPTLRFADGSDARLEELRSRTFRPEERDVLERLAAAVRGRKSGMYPLEGAIAGCLVYSDVEMRKEFPQQLAEALFDNPLLVYDVTEALEADAPRRRSDAVWGRPARFAQAGALSLPQFVEKEGRGVVVFDAAERYDPVHIALLAGIVDRGSMTSPNGLEVDARNICVIVWGRFPVDSPEALGFATIGGTADWGTGTRFELAVSAASARNDPRRLPSEIQSRFAWCVSGLWEILQARVVAGNISEPLLVARSPLSEEPYAPSPKAHSVPAVAPLTQVRHAKRRFEFFVSYSWTRHADSARKLVSMLGRERVFFDRDQINPNESMDALIPTLVSAVRSCEAVILFPIQLGEPWSDGARQAEALERGLAINAPAVGDTVTVQWSWQTLELHAASHVLVLGDSLARAFIGGVEDPEFIPRPCRSLEEQVAACEAYLARRREPSPWRR